MAREMLKLRKGDSAIMIKKNGSMELAGLSEMPLMDENGRVSPIILFAAAWATKDQNIFDGLFINFKNSVRDGKFGPDAQNDLKIIEKAAASATVTTQAPSGAVSMPDNLNPAEAAEYLNSKGIHSQEEAAKALQARDDEIKEAMNYGKEEGSKENPADEEIDPDDIPHDMKVVVDGIEYDPSRTAEEQAKIDEEERLLRERAENLKKNYDPRHERQREALLAGGKVTSVEPLTVHKLPDLPVEQTMAYQKASNNDRKKMKEEEAKKKEEPIVGNVTIEEEVGNENK